MLWHSAPALDYTASKAILCDFMEWRVTWRSRSQRPRISGEVVFIIDGQPQPLGDAQSEVFGKLDMLNEVGATCDQWHDGSGRPTIFPLTMLGIDGETGLRVLVEIRMGRDGEVHWFYEVIAD